MTRDERPPLNLRVGFLALCVFTLLGLLNVCYALAARAWPRLEDPPAGRALLAALLLMPLGFLLGGAFARAGDPGVSVGLAAAGGVALLFGLLKIAVKAH